MPVSFSALLNSRHYALAPDLVLTDDGPQRGHSVIVDGRDITWVGPIAQLPPGEAPVALPGHAIIPGFTDAHTHLGLTFGKSLIGGEPAQIWRRIWGPMEAAHDAESAYASAKWQFLEQLRGGFTGVVNYTSNSPVLNAAVHRAADEVGIRLVSTILQDESASESTNGPFIPFSDLAAGIDQHIADVGRHRRITASVSSSGFFRNRPDTLGAIGAYAHAKGILHQIHANEHFPEVHEINLRHGLRPIELLDRSGALGPQTLIHHATLATDREVSALARSGAAVSYNPVASEWKGNAVAPALAFVAHGVRFGLGSDATRYDGFRTLDEAEHAQRLVFGLRTEDFSSGAAWTWVDAITRGSADAAGWSNAGLIAAGYRADFLILDTDRPETLPSWDFEWELVRYYNRDQIAAVVVDGQPVLIGGQAVGWDSAEFIRRHGELARRVGQTPGITRVHGASERYRPKRQLRASPSP